MVRMHPYLAAPPPRAFAHRGWHIGDLADLENSLPAFRRAASEGYQYIETDVHATSDGVAVIHHDALLDRTTDGHGPIRERSWRDVRRMRIGGREPLARLEDALEELPDVFFNVDVKADSAVFPFLRAIERTQAYDRVAVAAFSDVRLARIRRLAGPRLMSSMGPRSAALLWASGWSRFAQLRGFTRGAMAQVPVRQGRLTIVDAAFVRCARMAGIEVHVWTVNEVAEMRRLLRLGVHGLITDRPDLLREVLREEKAWPSV